MLVRLRSAGSQYTIALSDGNPMREQIVSIVTVNGFTAALSLAGAVALDNKASVWFDPKVSEKMFAGLAVH